MARKNNNDKTYRIEMQARMMTGAGTHGGDPNKKARKDKNRAWKNEMKAWKDAEAWLR